MKKRNEDWRAERERRIAAGEIVYRNGVPNGMRRKDAEPLWARARELADRFIEIMKDNGELSNEIVEVINEEGETSLVEVPSNDTGKAEAALREAFVMAVGPSTQNIKIQAINTVLAYTKSKPESKVSLKTNPEAFLDAVAADLAAKGNGA